MATKLEIKKGRGVPKDAEMAEAELALDLDDGTLYSKLGDGLVHALNEAPDADNYGHWKLQVDYGTPYEVESGRSANFEGKGGVDVSRAGDTVTIDGSGIAANLDADNYQYWTYKINGFSTTNVLSTQELDFQSGDGIDIAREGYGIKISATGGDGGAGLVISDTEPTDKVEGMQWLENTTGKVWIWDGSAWFQFPQGKDGAAGKDGNIADGAADGSQDGVFAVWDDTAQQWVPTSNIAMNVNGHISTPSGVNLNARGNLGALAGKVTVYANEQPDTDPTIEMTGQGNCVARISTNKGLVVDDYNGADLITINSTGEATFSGNATFKGNVDTWQLNTSQIRNVNGGFGIGANGDGQKRIVPVTNDGQAPGVIDFGSNTIRWKNGYFANQVITRSGVSIGTRDLIETLSTLRASTLDEAVDVRQALASACDKLIEKFTEMEKTATQEVEDDS